MNSTATDPAPANAERSATADPESAAERKRCAVVECYHRHDEVYPTTVHLLQQLGYEVHLFTTFSSVAAAIGFNSLPVAHEDLARHYSIDDIAITYRDELLSALRQALDLSDQEMALRRERLAAARQRYLAESKASLGRSIARLGTRTRPVPMRPDLRPLETLAG